MQFSASTTPAYSPPRVNGSTSVAPHLEVDTVDSLPKTTSPRQQRIVRQVDELAKLETELKCPICKDFYDIPMSSKCQHTFCAGCTKFDYNNNTTGLCCPVCEYPFTSFNQFYKNNLIVELVKEYKNNRELIKRLCLLGQERERRKENKGTTISVNATTPLKPISDNNFDSTNSQTEQIEGKFKSKCVSEDSINENDNNVNEQNNKRKQMDDDNNKSFRPNKNIRTLINTPLCKKPKIAYGLMNEKKLRNILKDEGLSTQGSKSEMIARHSYFINLYNSNVDATNPKSKGELLREMKKWERAQQSDEAKDANLLKKSLTNPEEVSSYVNRYQNQFAELIQQASENKKRKEMLYD